MRGQEGFMVTEVPFTGHAGGIALGFHEFGQSCFIRMQTVG